MTEDRAVKSRLDVKEEMSRALRNNGERGEGRKRDREVAQVARDFQPAELEQQYDDPFESYHSIGTALKAMEELSRLKGVVGTDPAGVRRSLQVGGVNRVFSTEELVAMIQEVMSNAIPGLVQDLDTLLASVVARYGLPQASGITSGLTQQASARQAIERRTVTQQALLQRDLVRQRVQSVQLAQMQEPLPPPLVELARETMVRMHGSPQAVVEKKMSNREYMSRFRLNTRFASALLPAYDHRTAVPTIYGALERLLLADITICTVDGRAFQVVYELARTVKNDWLHHRFTTGWAEVVKKLGIEIGDMLVFERWTEDRTILTMQIVKECYLADENPELTWNKTQMTAAQRRGQF